MAIRQLRCGTSNAAFHRVPTSTPAKKHSAPRREPGTPRLRTSIHLAWRGTVTHEFRVMAELEGGTVALVCLGRTADEALTSARARRQELPAGTVRLYLQRWVGSTYKGRWTDLFSARARSLQPAQLRRRRNRLPLAM